MTDSKVDECANLRRLVALSDKLLADRCREIALEAAARLLNARKAGA